MHLRSKLFASFFVFASLFVFSNGRNSLSPIVLHFKPGKMSSNLTNVYAYLRKTFLDVDMMLSKPVSYVKTLVDAEKVIFIYKEVGFVVFALNSKLQ